MYFAAQFRAATGLRPHEYLLRRRIERAQEILLGSGICIVDVALSVGFQTQSHFTTVFKRFVGQSPDAWRQSQRGPEPSRAERSRQSSLNLTRDFSANGLAASSRATYPTTRPGTATAILLTVMPVGHNLAASTPSDASAGSQ
jgi:AraC-like DNA-binding protein